MKELEIIERDNTHAILYLWEDINDLDIYDRAKVINRFLTKESKIMEISLETILRDFLRDNGIIPLTMDKNALNEAFERLKLKGKSISIIDRNKIAYDETIVGVSDNQMTVIIDKYGIISISMEVRINNL